MIASMTGYGAASLRSDVLEATATVRSLNHRFLDVAVHVPRRFQCLESDVKRLTQGLVCRGRVEVSLDIRRSSDTSSSVQPSRDLIAAFVGALRQVKAEHGLAGEVGVAEVARFPGAFEVLEDGATVEDGQKQALLELVEKALVTLVGMRQTEGRGIEAALSSALTEIDSVAGRIEGLSAGERSGRREQLLARLREIRDELGLEDGRLYQEAVKAAERMDVSEEVQRLRSHVRQAREAMQGPAPCGKRLDFLAQELGREANTIGSKVQSAPLTREVVALKAEIERFREQVQNVE